MVKATSYTRVCVFDGANPHVLFVKGECPGTLAGREVKASSTAPRHRHDGPRPYAVVQPVYASLPAVLADLKRQRLPVRESLPVGDRDSFVYPNPFEA